MASQRQAAGDDAGTGPLWFNPPGGEESRRARSPATALSPKPWRSSAPTALPP